MPEEQLKAFLVQVKGDSSLQERLKAAANPDAVRPGSNSPLTSVIKNIDKKRCKLFNGNRYCYYVYNYYVKSGNKKTSTAAGSIIVLRLLLF